MSTVSANGVVRLFVLVALFSVSVKFPSVADVEAVRVRSEEPPAATVLGANSAETPEGSPEAESVTLPAKPPSDATETVVVSVLPRRTIPEAGEADGAKSGATTVSD